MSDKVSTKESQREDWHFQLSWKLGPHMLNVRADNMEQFREYLKALVEAPEMIVSALSTFDFQEPKPTPAPVQQPLPAPAPAPAPKGDEVEVGPLTITKVEHQEGISAKGRPYTRHTIHLSSGVKASTFDALVADVAQNLLGKPAYARVEKSKFGYELLNVRPAA
jgi:hypothetical protein